MEDELTNSRRSTRSRSKPPMEITEFRSEPSSRTSSKFQAIQEVIVQEKTQSTEVVISSVSVQQTFVQNDETIELQNRLNQNQESTKLVSAKTAGSQAEKTSRRSVRAKQSTVNVNGSSTVRRVKKSIGQSSDVTNSIASGGTVAFTPVSTRSTSYQASTSGQRITRSTDSTLARKFYESAMSGEKDVSSSVFWRYYKPVGEWWNYYPKTDNTYSPLSKYRYELAPGMMAMPNLSRRSIQGVSTSSAGYSSWFSSADSDSEEYETRKTTTTSTTSHRQASFMQRITTTTKYMFMRTVTTVLTIFSVLYAYTIGAAVGLFTTGTSQRQGTQTPLLIRPFSWIVDLVRYFSLIEVSILSWFSQGQRRNIMLWLLLFLLFAVPAYILYQGEEGGGGVLTWISDGITNLLLLSRTIFATPLAWLAAGISKVWNVAVIMATTPVQWLISLTSGLLMYAQYPFIWIFAALSQEDKVSTVQNSATIKVPETLVLSEGKNYNQELNVELLSSQILQSNAFKNLQADLKSDFKVPESHTSLLLHITEELKDMRANLENLKQESESKPADSKQYIFHALQREIKNLERKVRLLQLHQNAGKQCCDNMDEQVAAIVAGLFSGGDGTVSDDAAIVIKTKLSALDNLEARLAKFSADLEESQKSALEGLRLQVNNQASEVKPSFDLTSLSDERVRAIVREVLAVYDADKTNMVDYALETSGGTILSTRCTENYDYKHGVTFYWGLSWFSKEYRPNNPRTIIQPSVNPGECWAFKGATGFVVIELSTFIHVTSVSMEHIPRSLAPNGKIESAPRDFTVWGLKELMDPEPVLLGKFRFEDNGQPLQTFQVNTEHSGFQRIELRIESNHGHLEYTCVYRFRIHGIPAIS